MSMQTQQQSNVTGKKSFGQTVAQSFKVMGGADVSNYSLYFLNPTKRNRAGEHETIVIPYIEIGRGSSCAVQYGDDYPTVGRKHAAIRFSDGNIMLKHLSSTNPTLIMRTDGGTDQLSTPGQEIQLENGYQIQFSYDGPMLRLNATPTATSKMGVTQRVQLALSQGIRPYRNAVVGLALALVALACISTHFLIKSNDQVQDLKTQLVDIEIDAQQKEQEYKELIAEGKAENDKEVKAAKRAAYLARKEAQALATKVDALQNSPVSSSSSSSSSSPTTRPDGGSTSSPSLPSVSNLEKYKPSIYYIFPKSVKVRHPDLTQNQVFDLTEKVQNSGLYWSGTAFLTDEGKLITARHVITPWRFPENCNDIFTVISQCELGGSVDATYSILAPGGTEVESFTLDEVHVSPTEDEKLDNACPGLQVMRCPDSGMYTDWAWVNMNFKGNIPMNRELSKQLNSGQTLEIYGYSKGLQLQDLSRRGLDPLYGICNVAQDGLPNKIIRVANRPFTGGASGGPVFARKNGTYYAVGIISHGIDNIGGIVPVTHLK